jgi:hypothetical protein
MSTTEIRVSKAMAMAMRELHRTQAFGLLGQNVMYLKLVGVWEGRVLPKDELHWIDSGVRPTRATIAALVRRGWVYVNDNNAYRLTDKGKGIDARY